MTEASPTLFIDFDSSLVMRETLDDLAALALEDHPDRESVYSELEELTARGMNGDMPFDVSLTARIGSLSGIAHSDHIEELNDTLVGQLSDSAVKHSDWFDRNAKRILVISGGFEEIIIPTVAHLGILATNVHANRFIFDADGYIIGHDADRLTAQAGGKAAQSLELGIGGPGIAVGDGYTDLEICQAGAADEFWAFIETVERPGVVAKADRVIASFAELAVLI
jgi:D-3-phosphoglycerate dehydrogenase